MKDGLKRDYIKGGLNVSGINEAISKLEAEMESNKTNRYIQYVGQYMVDHLNEKPDHAENILAEGKTIADSLKHMERVAKAKKSSGMVVLTPEEGFKAVMEYYGINEGVSVVKPETVPKKRKVRLSLDDLL